MTCGMLRRYCAAAASVRAGYGKLLLTVILMLAFCQLYFNITFFRNTRLQFNSTSLSFPSNWSGNNSSLHQLRDAASLSIQDNWAKLQESSLQASSWRTPPPQPRIAQNIPVKLNKSAPGDNPKRNKLPGNKTKKKKKKMIKHWKANGNWKLPGGKFMKESSFGNNEIYENIDVNKNDNADENDTDASPNGNMQDRSEQHNKVFDERNEQSDDDNKDKTVMDHSSSSLTMTTSVKHKSLLSDDLPPCPLVPPNLEGPVSVNVTPVVLSAVEGLHPELLPGGSWAPTDCLSNHRVAIIIPYRSREAQLPVLLRHMHPFLQKQQIDYTIYVVEQADVGVGNFNRALLLNIGALESVKLYPYQCFIFHDVDLLPEDDRNLYTCPQQPRHMSVAIDIFNYWLPDRDLFGGVSAMSVDHFREVNGFSNEFWGLGAEDDDMKNRIKFHGLNILRYPASIARYTMLKHIKEQRNPKMLVGGV